MPTNGAKPIKEWGPLERLEHGRLNVPLRQMITDISAGPGLVYARNGNTAVLGLGRRDGTPMERAVVAMVTGEATGGGQYVGKIVQEPSTATGAESVGLASLVNLPSTEDALIIHPPEMGTSDHELDPGTFAVGRIVGRVESGTHAGKLTVIIESFVDAAGVFGVVKFTATGNMTVGSRVIAATSATTGAESVACVVGHKSGDTIFAAQPAGGTGVGGTSWLEMGVLGQDFEVELVESSGTGSPQDPYKYDSKRGSSQFGADDEPIDRPFRVTANEPAEFGRGRFIPGLDTFELVEAFESHSPVVPVLLTASGSPPPGGSDASTITYTVRDRVTLETFASGVAHPNRPFGDTFKVESVANWGFGYHATDGSFVLISAIGEVYTTTPGCPPPA